MHPDGARAQSGNSNHLDVYLLNRSLGFLLDLGLDTIAPYVTTLTNRLHQGVASLGLDVITPASATERGSSISFASAMDREIQRRAARDQIYVWDGGGRVRASVHLFNSSEDIERYLTWLADNVTAGA